MCTKGRTNAFARVCVFLMPPYQVARDNASKMAGGLMHFRKDNPYCGWFARLWRLVDPLSEADCDSYLSLLSTLHGLRSGPHDILLSPDGMQYMV